MARPHKCPYCGASRSISKGVRVTKYEGVRRLRLCRACGRKFTPRKQRYVSETDYRAQREHADDDATS